MRDICVESGCEIPVTYELVARCRLHAVLHIQQLPKHQTGTGRCYECGVVCLSEGRGSDPLRCPEHTRQWIIEKTSALRIPKESPALWDALQNGSTCPCGAHYWQHEHALPDKIGGMRKVCPTCWDKGWMIEKWRPCTGCGKGPLLSPGSQRCGSCLQTEAAGKAARALETAQRQAARKAVEAAERAQRPCPIEGCETVTGGKFCEPHRTTRRREQNHRNTRKRYATKKGGTLAMERADLEFLFDEGAKCRYCGSAERLTIEHVIPLNRGGTHTIENIDVACWSCNCSKQDLTEAEWFASGRPLVPEHLRTV